MLYQSKVPAGFRFGNSAFVVSFRRTRNRAWCVCDSAGAGYYLPEIAKFQALGARLMHAIDVFRDGHGAGTDHRRARRWSVLAAALLALPWAPAAARDQLTIGIVQ